MRHLLGISELKLGVDNGILRHGYCHMYLLMWVDSHNQISGWYLTESSIEKKEMADIITAVRGNRLAHKMTFCYQFQIGNVNGLHFQI